MVASVVVHFFGWTGLFVAAIGITLIVVFVGGYRKCRDRRRAISLARAPCRHGTVGAQLEPTKCAVCQADHQEAEHARRREEEQQRLRTEAKRAQVYKEWLAAVRLPEFLKTMDPQAFEELVCSLFARMGYTVEPTPYTGDSGADGYLYKDGQKSVLQCKRVKGSVGEPVLRDLFGTMHATNSSSAVVVTTGRVSKRAQQWVSEKPIRIIGLDELRRLIDNNFHENDVVPPTFSPHSAQQPHCPKCGHPLHLVHGRRGPFLGCTAYPACRFTQAAKRTRRNEPPNKA